MKAIFSIIVFILGGFVCTPTFAAGEDLDWENDMKLYINYDETKDEIEAIATIPSDDRLKDQFSLGIFVDGREYRKFFDYNSTNRLLFVDFTIPQTLRNDTRIFLSVKDAQYYEVYTDIPSGYSVNSRNTSQNTSIRSELGSVSTGVRDYGVFSMQVSRSPQSTVTTNTINNHLSSINASNRKNISDLTRSELLGVVQDRNYEDSEIEEIIQSLQKFDIISDMQENMVEKEAEKNVPVSNTSTQNTSSQTRKDIQIYKNRLNQPKKINGIGNSYAYYSVR